MNSPCRDFLDAMLENALERALPEPIARHVAGCPACAQALERMLRTRDALASLPARNAPEMLDGLVVAATQAGHRQERAVAHLQALLRESAPRELEGKLGGGGVLLSGVPRQPAPAVLERLVDEDLRDPRKALARRYLQRLERMGAPELLRTRVARVLAAPPRPARRGLFLGAAALLFVLAGLWTLHALSRSSARVPYELVYVDDLSQLEPIARDMLAGMTGGLSEVAGKEHP